MPSGHTKSDLHHLFHSAEDCFGGWAQLVCLPLKCLAGMGGSLPNHIYSRLFDFPAAVGLTLVPGTLTLGIAGFGMGGPEHLPGPAVSCDPNVLTATDTMFRVVVDMTKIEGAPGGTYTGTVWGSTAPNQPLNPNTDPLMRVWIVVP